MKKNKLPVLDKTNTLNALINTFAEELRSKGFEGDIHSDYASRISSMDNSVYFVVPELVVFPYGKNDVNRIFAWQVSKNTAKSNSRLVVGGQVLLVTHYVLE